MSHRKVIFLLFAVAFFFSAIRGGNAPSACVRPIFSPARAREFESRARLRAPSQAQSRHHAHAQSVGTSLPTRSAEYFCRTEDRPRLAYRALAACRFGTDQCEIDLRSGRGIREST